SAKCVTPRSTDSKGLATRSRSRNPTLRRDATPRTSVSLQRPLGEGLQTESDHCTSSPNPRADLPEPHSRPNVAISLRKPKRLLPTAADSALSTKMYGVRSPHSTKHSQPFSYRHMPTGIAKYSSFWDITPVSNSNASPNSG